MNILFDIKMKIVELERNKKKKEKKKDDSNITTIINYGTFLHLGVGLHIY